MFSAPTRVLDAELPARPPDQLPELAQLVRVRPDVLVLRISIMITSIIRFTSITSITIITFIINNNNTHNDNSSSNNGSSSVRPDVLVLLGGTTRLARLV